MQKKIEEKRETERKLRIRSRRGNRRRRRRRGGLLIIGKGMKVERKREKTKKEDRNEN